MLLESKRLVIDCVNIDRIDLASILKKIIKACEGSDPIQIVTVNLNFITLARCKPFFCQVINKAHVVVPDGRFILWFSKLMGDPLPDQITGHDLMRECLRMGNERGYRMFLLGGMPGVARSLCKKFAIQYPEMQFDGMSGGRFSETGECVEQDKVLTRIRDFRPHFLFVALGAPKQDAWISKNLVSSKAKVAVGVGGVFDTLIGQLPRAPRWMQICGLESVFQLIVEPRRYWRRYLLDDPKTLARIVVDILKRRLI